MIQSVVMIGSGNLGTQLALALHEINVSVLQVYSRREESAKLLAKQVHSEYTSNLSAIRSDADLYIIAVKDSVIPEILENLPSEENRFFVHTAGSVTMSVLDGFTTNYGVFYPLQTFSKRRKVDFSNLPICLEANHPSNLLKLQELAGRLSKAVRQVSSEERKALHLAAIFANNFVNHFYALSAEILRDKKLDFDLLKPLIRETAAKIEVLSPIEAQTGPARRNDQEVIHDQLKMLHNRPEFQKIYSFVTESIIQFHQKHNHDLF